DAATHGVDAVVGRDGPVFEAMRAALGTAGTPAQVARRRATAARLTDDLVDPDLADLLSGLTDLGLVGAVAGVARGLDGAGPAAVHSAMLRIGAHLGLDRLAAIVDRVPVGPGWERRERKGLAAAVQRLHAAALRGGARIVGGLDG